MWNNKGWKESTNKTSDKLNSNHICGTKIQLKKDSLLNYTALILNSACDQLNLILQKSSSTNQHCNKRNTMKQYIFNLLTYIYIYIAFLTKWKLITMCEWQYDLFSCIRNNHSFQGW